MAKKDSPLTARSSIATWLDHPTGGPLIRDLLGQAAQDENALKPEAFAAEHPDADIVTVVGDITKADDVAAVVGARGRPHRRARQHRRDHGRHDPAARGVGRGL
jgi:hypothetical protein